MVKQFGRAKHLLYPSQGIAIFTIVHTTEKLNILCSTSVACIVQDLMAYVKVHPHFSFLDDT